MVDIESPGSQESRLSAAIRELAALVTLDDQSVSGASDPVVIHELGPEIWDLYDSIDFVAYNAKPVVASPMAGSLNFKVYPTGEEWSNDDGHFWIGGPNQGAAQELNQMRFTVHLGKCVNGDRRIVLGQWIGQSESGENANMEKTGYVDPHADGLTVRWFFEDNFGAGVDVDSGRFIAYGHKLPPVVE